MGETLEDYLLMTREALDVGLCGVTYGRLVWRHPHMTAVIRALCALIHEDARINDAMEVYQSAKAEIVSRTEQR